MKRYHILDLIGAGGTGVVYRAHDRLTGALVALKQLDSSLNDWASLTMQGVFLQSIVHEFGILASLRHPHIIAVLDYGLDAGRRPFFTMELLDQPQTIAEAAFDLPLVERLDLLIQMLQALSYLHRRGILHRDLKPSNVLVVENSVRVLDFGLASPSSERRSGEKVGTSAYMSPETLRDGVHSSASDLYAVGVIAYECFTGNVPFEPGDILAVLGKQPDLDSPDIPPTLKPILARLLAKQPAARYPDADAVIGALAAVANIEIEEAPTIRESYLQAAPFIGRVAERARLNGALDSVVAGRGGTILIGGESGAGKSRLLNDLWARALTAGAAVIWGQAVSDGGLPYQLWRETIAHLAINTNLSDFEAGVLAQALPDVERLIARAIPPIAPLTGDAGQQRLAQMLVTLLQRLEQPVVLLLEDMHWAGDNLAILKQFVRQVDTLPLLIIATYRSDDAPGLPAELPDMNHISLNRFSSDEIAQLTAAMIGKASQTPTVIDRLQRESDGNVLFLIETIRFLAEQTGNLADIGAAALPDTIFPASIAQIVRHRLSFLPASARDLLDLAATAGRELDLDLIRAVMGASPEIDGWLYACAAAAVLEIRDNRWRFAHDKLRETLLSDLAPQPRALLHRRLAQTLEALYPDDSAQAQRLAAHWDGAGEVDRALHYTLIAGEVMRQNSSMGELKRVTDRGLALLRPSGDEVVRVRLLMLLGYAHFYNDFSSSQQAFEAAYAHAEAAGLAADVAEAALGVASVYVEKNEFAAAEPMLDQTLTYAAAHGATGLLEEALRTQAEVRYRTGHIERALAGLSHSLQLAQQLEDERLIATNLMAISQIYVSQNRFDEALPPLQEAVQIGETIGSLRLAGRGLMTLGLVAGRQADVVAAAAYFERAITFYTIIGYHSLLCACYNNRAKVAELSGDLEAMQTWYEKGRDLALEIDSRRHWLMAQGGLAILDYRRGNFAAARAAMTEVVRLCGEVNFSPILIGMYCTLVETNLKLGDLAGARAVLLEGLQTAQTLDAPIFNVDLVSAAIPYALFQEDWEAAAEWYGLTRFHPQKEPSDFPQLDGYYRTLADELDANTLHAAVERGKALDLKITVEALLQDLAAEMAHGSAIAE